VGFRTRNIPDKRFSWGHPVQNFGFFQLLHIPPFLRPLSQPSCRLQHRHTVPIPHHHTQPQTNPTATFPRPFIPPIIPFPHSSRTRTTRTPPSQKNSQTTPNIKPAEINGVETSGHGCRANRRGGNGGIGAMEMEKRSVRVVGGELDKIKVAEGD
jgi:hypothetical protein